jgi:hypothetical protein
MRPACDTLYDDIERFGKRVSARVPSRYFLDTNLALRDVGEVEIFILAEPIGACVLLTANRHHALSE